jgi:hypothetical protein
LGLLAFFAQAAEHSGSFILGTFDGGLFATYSLEACAEVAARARPGMQVSNAQDIVLVRRQCLEARLEIALLDIRLPTYPRCLVFSLCLVDQPPQR